MTRSHIVALLALIVTVPAAAVGGTSLFTTADTPCFSAGDIGYRLIGKGPADYTVRIDSAAAQPDLAVQIVDDPAIADFVLVDGIESTTTCSGARTVRTIRVDKEARDPDLTIALVPADGTGRFKIYAHSMDFTVQDVAALFAVMSKASRKRDVAAR